MTGTSINPDAEIFIEKIKEAEDQVSQHAASVKKLTSLLSQARKTLANKPAVISSVSALISNLKKHKLAPDLPSLDELSDSLNGDLAELQKRIQKLLPADLRSACEAANLPFNAKHDGFGVGSFYVTLNAAKETAAFQFAKVDLGISVPQNASAIVEQVISLTTSLIDEPVDVVKFATDLYEAMRVSLARQSKFPKTELRVELPSVLKELDLIRQISPSRFVVELKELIQSDQNLRSDRPFKLETAVLENTKNRKKSIFIPNDIKCAYGEGTYYQAILRQHA